MGKYRIIIADDHVIFRKGMKRLIGEISDLEVVGEANDGLQLLKLLKETETDMVLLDISMPGLRGIEATREIKMVYPHVSVLILTMHKNIEYLYHGISAGAQGYLLKEDSDVELLTAIEAIRNGDIYITTLLAGEIAGDLSALQKGEWEPLSIPLSIREREILKLISEGEPNKEIADILHISKRTVETHRAKIMRKLNLKNTAELVRYAIEKGITDVNN